MTQHVLKDVLKNSIFSLLLRLVTFLMEPESVKRQNLQLTILLTKRPVLNTGA